MTNFIKLFALLFAVAAAVFYCKISNASTNVLNENICMNQAMSDDDGCNTYVITD
jgi:hypothetical protein